MFRCAGGKIIDFSTMIFNNVCQTKIRLFATYKKIYDNNKNHHNTTNNYNDNQTKMQFKNKIINKIIKKIEEIIKKI